MLELFVIVLCLVVIALRIAGSYKEYKNNRDEICGDCPCYSTRKYGVANADMINY